MATDQERHGRWPSTAVARAWAAAPVAIVGTVGDPEGTRTVTAIVALLIAIGIGLVMLAIWLFRVTRPDPELLAPLEVMSDRAWRRGDPVWQRRRLDEVRPVGAEPLAPSVAPPEIDEAFDAGPVGSGFDDLREAAVSGDVDAIVVSVPGDPLIGSRPSPPSDGRPPAPPSAAERPRVSVVESAARQPVSLDPPVGEPVRPIDPEVLAAAMAELDAELEAGRQRPSTGQGAPGAP